MNRLETTFGLISITSLFIYLLVSNLLSGISEYIFWLLILSPVAALVLNLVFLKDLSFSPKATMIPLFTAVWLTDIFKVLNLPAADILAIFSHLLFLPVLGVALLFIGFKNPKSIKPYLLIAGSLLVIQFLIPVTMESWNQHFPRMISHYVLAAVTFAAAIKYPSEKTFEKQLIVLLFIYSAQNVILSIF